MTDGIMLTPGEGRRIVGKGLDATVKSTMDLPALTASFEIVIPPGYDVGAHVHAHGEEIFYVVEGELDILAFDPVDRTVSDWYQWESSSGKRYLHGTAGAFMFVPVGVPHAFANPSRKPTKMFFQSSVPGGHENYFDDLVALLRRSDGSPDPKDISDLRRRYDIEQLTPLRAGSSPLREEEPKGEPARADEARATRPQGDHTQGRSTEPGDERGHPHDQEHDHPHDHEHDHPHDHEDDHPHDREHDHPHDGEHDHPHDQDENSHPDEHD